MEQFRPIPEGEKQKQTPQERGEGIRGVPPPYGEPQPTELSKAREALIVFVAGTERNSARSKAFSNLVSEHVISQLPDPGEPMRIYASHVQWLMSEEFTQKVKNERRVQTNTALVKGYSLERARVLVRLREQAREWRDGPGRHYTNVNVASAYPHEVQAIRAEIFARQQQARPDPPQE